MLKRTNERRKDLFKKIFPDQNGSQYDENKWYWDI